MLFNYTSIMYFYIIKRINCQ